MEKAGLMEAFVYYLFRIPRMILLLSLMALACLPIALSGLVRDASVSLLLPLTFLGALLAWGLARSRVRKRSIAIILLFIGPLALFIRMGQLAGSIVELVKQTLAAIPSLINWLYQRTPFDPQGFVAASSELTYKFIALGMRLFSWFAGLWQGIQVEDPLIRTLMWSMALWLIAAWAGWQISHNKRLLAGLIPATILLAFVLDYTGKERWILWLHLSLLLFLYGLTGYANLRERWDISRVDYSDSTGLDTLLIVGVLTLGLVTVSSLASMVSIKDILDRFREERSASNEARTESLGLEPAKENRTVAGSDSAFPDHYAIGAGPELSEQLVMTVSTGDLPPMPLYAQPVARNYYWRTVTYGNYTGSGWRNPESFVEDVPPNEILISPPYPNYRLVSQEVTFLNETAERMYWTGILISTEIPFRAVWFRKSGNGPLLESDMIAALAAVKTFRADSLRLDVSAQDLRSSPGVYPDWVRDRFLVLPDSVPERVLALGRDLSASGKTPFDRALAIQNYLREFPYTLDVPAPPPGRDAADFFLFDLKKGYCDYYATTMVVLARAAGLPARMVMGYSSGTYDVEQARYFVAENNAHAWVEVYFTNIGWVEFEPTASQPAIIYPEAGNSQPPVKTSEPQGFVTGQWARLFNNIFSYTWIPLLLFTILVVVWAAWDSLRLAQLEPSKSIQLLYRRLLRLARRVSGPASIDQTAHEYAFALNTHMSSLITQSRFRDWMSPAGDDITRLIELYSRSIFAPVSPTGAEAREVIKVWPRLQMRLLIASVISIINQWSQVIRQPKD